MFDDTDEMPVDYDKEDHEGREWLPKVIDK
jgi:hypothetical protein